MLHLRHDLERHIHAGPAREISELSAVVEQCLIGPGLNVHRREAFEVGMERVGERILAIASFAEKRASHSLNDFARNQQILRGICLECFACRIHVEPGRERHRGRRQRQTLLAGAQYCRHCQRTARRISDQCNVTGPDALVEQPVVAPRHVVYRAGMHVLGGSPVMDNECAAAYRLRHMGVDLAVSVHRPGHVPAAMRAQ